MAATGLRVLFLTTAILTTRFRIVDNTHLLDATEIFRKLNVHKKAGLPTRLVLENLRTYTNT